MKKLFYVIQIILITLACHKSAPSIIAIDPMDLLYRRWQALDSGEYTTFLAEGVILYGKDGTLGVCCEPQVFLRQDSLLKFTDVPYHTIPAFVQKVNCSYVRCASLGDSWRILSLTTSQLILQTRRGKRAYKAA